VSSINIGVDIGSISVKIVALDDDKNILTEIYERHHGHPNETFMRLVNETLSHLGEGARGRLAFTGSGGKALAVLLEECAVNEIIAQARGTSEYYPQVKTIIEIGGEDSKLITLTSSASGKCEIDDFTMNTMCAAGTGSFLDQQATRLEVKIEELGDLALKSKTPPRMAGRCSVFAKTDMIHLQQQATPDYDIVSKTSWTAATEISSSPSTTRRWARSGRCSTPWTTTSR